MYVVFRRTTGWQLLSVLSRKHIQFFKTSPSEALSLLCVQIHEVSGCPVSEVRSQHKYVSIYARLFHRFEHDCFLVYGRLCWVLRYNFLIRNFHAFA